jgi:chromosome segregation ATPase
MERELAVMIADAHGSHLIVDDAESVKGGRAASLKSAKSSHRSQNSVEEEVAQLLRAESGSVRSAAASTRVSDVSDMQTDLDKQGRRIAGMRKIIKQTREELSEKEETLVALVKENQQLRVELTESAETCQALDKRVADYRRAMDGMREEMMTRDDKLDKLINELNDERTTLSETQSKVVRTQKLMDGMRELIDRSREEKQQQEDQAVELVQQVEALLESKARLAESAGVTITKLSLVINKLLEIPSTREITLMLLKESSKKKI